MTEITTTEFEEGVAKKVKARFRVYGSYMEAIGDYVKLLTNNPRYANVASASSPEQAAHALQKAGYATDSAVCQKAGQHDPANEKRWGAGNQGLYPRFAGSVLAVGRCMQRPFFTQVCRQMADNPNRLDGNARHNF